MSLQGEAQTLQRTRPRGKQVELQGGSLRSRLGRDTGHWQAWDRAGYRRGLGGGWLRWPRPQAPASRLCGGKLCGLKPSARCAPLARPQEAKTVAARLAWRGPAEKSWSERGRGGSEMLPPSPFSASGCRPAHRPPASAPRAPAERSWRVRSGPRSPHTCAQEAFLEPETRLRSGQVRCLGPAQRCRCQRGTFIPQMEKLSPPGRSLRERRGRDEASDIVPASKCL